MIQLPKDVIKPRYSKTDSNVLTILNMSFNVQPMNLDLALKALDNTHRRTVLSAMRDPRKNFVPAEGFDPLLDGVCVIQIAKLLGVNQSTASSYMALLRDAGLVSVARVGRYTLYKRNENALAAVASAIIDQL